MTAAKTIVDIARELGLSKTTVADALKGTGRVAPATRERVRQLADASGYRPNKSARQLRTQASETIGLYIGADVRNMPFYMPFTFGALEEAAAHGFDMTLVTHPPGGAHGQLAGAVVIDALPDDPVLQGVLGMAVPVVSAGRLMAARTKAAGLVEIDYAATTTRAFDLLASLGSASPVLFAPLKRDPFAWCELIVDGYTKWCENRGIKPLTLRLSPYASNVELEKVLDTALDRTETDGLFFAWQDVADRAQAMLVHKLKGSRVLKTGCLVDSYLEDAHYPHDVLVDLGAHSFGRDAIRALKLVLDGSGPVRQQHPARVLAPQQLSQTRSEP
ncbi:LacI family DNA-binding transcriptional regulator [Amycolatopsis jejuensis]|uniref:LacI family DNA-binding transcriptional regulator n=1 Tax=Amycolatopsis jejuensis TaxID=330084 RepID=UPI000689D1E2|nr:LacI family DNA-binding transcriptional regulator [Amycolatopsis jejuensis]